MLPLAAPEFSRDLTVFRIFQRVAIVSSCACLLLLYFDFTLTGSCEHGHQLWLFCRGSSFSTPALLSLTFCGGVDPPLASDNKQRGRLQQLCIHGIWFSVFCRGTFTTSLSQLFHNFWNALWHCIRQIFGTNSQQVCGSHSNNSKYIWCLGTLLTVVIWIVFFCCWLDGLSPHSFSISSSLSPQYSDNTTFIPLLALLALGTHCLRRPTETLQFLYHSDRHTPLHWSETVCTPGTLPPLPTSGGIPGPKSGCTIFRVNRCSHWVLWFILLMLPSQSSWCEGEGFSAWSWGKEEIDFDAQQLSYLFPMKQQDSASQLGYGLNYSVLAPERRTAVQKRSFQRACKRAATAGFAWYRGSLIPFNAFPRLMRERCLSHSQSSPPKVPTVSSKPLPKGRMNIGNCNVGGLAKPRLQEIQHWALQHHIDVLVLTETRWSFSTEWSDSNWHLIHTGTQTDRADGILVLIRRSLCTTDSIGLAEVLPGRILHLRIETRNRAFDLVACYQFSDTRQLHRNHQRAAFWKALDAHAQTLPTRNSLLIAGDFNCALPSTGHHVGTDCFTLHGKDAVQVPSIQTTCSFSTF